MLKSTTISTYAVSVALSTRDLSALSSKAKAVVSGLPFGETIPLCTQLVFASTPQEARQFAKCNVSSFFSQSDMKYIEFKVSIQPEVVNNECSNTEKV